MPAATVPPATRRAPLAAVALAALLLALPSACGGERAAPSADSAVTATARVPVETTPAVDSCPKFGAWRECSVIDRLVRSGIGLQRGDSVRVAPFTPAGARFTIGAQQLTLFLYPDSLALAHDLAALDTARVQPRAAGAAPIAWGGAPTLIVSNNLAAVIAGGRERETERVTLALTAGLPATAGTRR